MPHPYEYQLKRDNEGRIIEKTETVAGKSVIWTYAYDKVGRLTEARLGNRLICQCWYDREGRRNQDCFPATAGKDLRRYTYRLDNRLMSAGNNGYTHDKNGFRSIWKHEGKYTTYQYAPDCRLLRAEKEDEGVVFEFAHDGEGRREAKFRNGELVEAYAWLDFLRLAGFHDGEHGHEFAYRENERTPYAMRRDDGAVAALLYDQVGSLRVVADMDGNVIKEILYDPFGGIIEDSNPALRIPLGFAGGLHDRDLGFVRFGWRDYDPFTSRWTVPDPMGSAGGDEDWYGYCLDDPVNGVDPLGLETKGYGAFGSLDGFGGSIGAGASWVTDQNGGSGLELYLDYGASSGWGITAGVARQETSASTIGELEGKSTKAGASASLPAPSRPNVGGEAVNGAGYTGYGESLGWSLGSPIPFEAHVKQERSVVLEKPFDTFGKWYEKQIEKEMKRRVK